jgi:hypothetical protein
MPINHMSFSVNQSFSHEALNFETIYEDEISLIERSGGDFDLTKDKCCSLAAICLSGGETGFFPEILGL